MMRNSSARLLNIVFAGILMIVLCLGAVSLKYFCTSLKNNELRDGKDEVSLTGQQTIPLCDERQPGEVVLVRTVITFRCSLDSPVQKASCGDPHLTKRTVAKDHS